METIRVVLADRDDLVVEGLRVLLETEEDLEIVGKADNGQTLLNEIRTQRPDVVVVDVALPVLDGVAATRCLRTLYPTCNAVLLAAHTSDREVIEGIRAGARGFLLKTCARMDLVEAIRAVARGDPVVHPALLPTLFDAVRYVPPPAATLPASPILSAREQTVLQLVAAGLTNARIAERLTITVATVKRHLSTIFEKLEVTNRHDAVAAAHAAHLFR
jgi:DNA-binding NarL/FixJ family response regulator